MWRNSFTVFLAYAVLLFSIGPTAYGQYPAAPDSAQAYPDQGYPAQQYPAQQYPQSYPQNQPYGGVPYPQAGQQPQDPNAGQNMGSDEQHGVARLSVVQGDVNVRRGDNGELVAAVTNAPIMAQDHLQTSPGSRAEVELDYGNLIRLAPNTEVGFADLEYHRYQLQLAAGAIIYRVLRDSGAQAEIDTPSIALRPEGQGEYRISVLNDGTTEISVRSGQAEIFSPHGSEQLAAGRTVLVRGNPGDPEFQPAYEAPRDQLDDWSATRDRELMASQSYRYVSPDINGAQDLDAYGNWVPSQYGQVWEPSDTSADWSPYSDGQWSWQPYYGWTWVDAAPWGWAPYHYGRWFWNGGHRWCWWPGSIGPRYLWSPALVGFFGAGAALGWVALAPFELFHPWWGSGFGRGGYGFGGYGRGNFGMVRGANIAGMYRNAAIRGGAMTASYNTFGGLRQHFTPANRGQLTGANLFRGQLPVSPTRASYQFSQRSAIANPRLASAANRQFFSHRSFGYGGRRDTESDRICTDGRVEHAKFLRPQQRIRSAGQEFLEQRLAAIRRSRQVIRIQPRVHRRARAERLAPLRRGAASNAFLLRQRPRERNHAELLQPALSSSAAAAKLFRIRWQLKRTLELQRPFSSTLPSAFATALQRSVFPRRRGGAVHAAAVAVDTLLLAVIAAARP